MGFQSKFQNGLKQVIGSKGFIDQQKAMFKNFEPWKLLAWEWHSLHYPFLFNSTKNYPSLFDSSKNCLLAFVISVQTNYRQFDTRRNENFKMHTWSDDLRVNGFIFLIQIFLSSEWCRPDNGRPTHWIQSIGPIGHPFN